MLLLLLKLDIMSKIVFGSNHGCFSDAFASYNASKPSFADDLELDDAAKSDFEPVL